MIELAQITKRFGATQALKNGQLHIKAGDIHALLGANGAGKSTLIKILAGVHSYDEGSFMIDGQTIRFSSPKEAQQAGIFTVYQEVDTALIPSLTVAENIVITPKNFWVKRHKMRQQAKEALALLQSTIDVNSLVSELTLAEKQLVLLARALTQKARLIIVDEPTAPLSSTEAKQLFAVMRKLQAQGVAFIFITHRLHEVFEVSNQVTVMRDGSHIMSAGIEEVTEHTIIEAMLGKSLQATKYLAPSAPTTVVAKLEHISDGNKVKDSSLTLYKGEVLGVFGLVGAGKTELAKVWFGEHKVTQGKFYYPTAEKKFTHPAEAIKAGVVLIPEERRKEGLFIEESVCTNLTFPSLHKFSVGMFIKKAREVAQSRKVIQQLGIKVANPHTPVHYLSGGNQQKVVIGKWLAQQAMIYLFDEPTKGVDIGAKEDIYQTVRQLAEQDKGVVYFSSESNEMLTVCDRIAVMYDGRIVAELTNAEATEQLLLYYASGGTVDEASATLSL